MVTSSDLDDAAMWLRYPQNHAPLVLSPPSPSPGSRSSSRSRAQSSAGGMRALSASYVAASTFSYGIWRYVPQSYGRKDTPGVEVRQKGARRTSKDEREQHAWARTGAGPPYYV